MSSAPTATVIVPTLGGPRLGRMLESLATQTVSHQTLVIDNGSVDGSVADAAERLEKAEVVRLDRNAGYTKAINLGAARAEGEVVVLLNDDCVVDVEFVERIVAALDPGAGVTMAAGVMRDWRDRSLIDSAGMELDRTLLVFDYLNGEPLAALDRGVGAPVGPSGAAAAFDRGTFLEVGGFDERLFAYWEDVDLVLRMRQRGFRCALAAGARGDHEHSATLGSGSARKNYLMGFGRGYVLSKWGVVSPRRLGPVLARELLLCAGQAVFDRNLDGVRGRLRGYRAADRAQAYPAELDFARSPDGVVATMRRRARRRSRLGAPPSPGRPRRALAAFHVPGPSGPLRSLEAELRWLGARAELTTLVPGPGAAADALAGAGEVVFLEYGALTAPEPSPHGLATAARQTALEVGLLRDQIRRQRPDLVVAVTTMLPALLIAAHRERVPVLVYAGELFAGASGPRALAGRGLIELTGRLADAVIACSGAVGAQFAGAAGVVEVVYPPIGPGYGGGDGAALRAAHAIPSTAPLYASVGNITEGRGQDVAIRALATLPERPDAHYLIAGEPFARRADLEYRDRLEQLAEELGLAGRVAFAGRVAAVADVYAAADVIVNPARVAESFGRVAFEAACAGTPAVVAGVGAVGELLRDGDSALVVGPDDPGELAAAVSRLLDDRELGRRLAASAAAIAAQRLTPELSLAGFARGVDAAVAGAGRARP